MRRKLFFLALAILAFSSSVLSIELKQFSLPGTKSKDSDDKEGDKEKKIKEDKAKKEEEKSHQSPFSGPKKQTKEEKAKSKTNPFGKKKADDKSDSKKSESSSDKKDSEKKDEKKSDSPFGKKKTDDKSGDSKKSSSSDKKDSEKDSNKKGGFSAPKMPGGGKKKDEEYKPDKFPKYDKCMAEKEPEGEHKPNGGFMSKFNFPGLGKSVGMSTKEVKERNPDGSVKESKEQRCNRIKEEEELELLAMAPITGVTRPVPTKKAMELMDIFQKGFLNIFTGRGFNKKKVSGEKIEKFAKMFAKKIETNDKWYKLYDQIDNNNAGKFGKKYRDALKAANEVMTKQMAATVTGKKVMVPVPQPSEKTKAKQKELDTKRDVKPGTPVPPKGPTVTAAQFKKFNLAMKQIMALVQHVSEGSFMNASYIIQWAKHENE